MFKPSQHIKIPTVQVAGDASPSLAPATLRLPLPPYSQLAVADDSPSQRFPFTTLQLVGVVSTPNRDDSDAGDAQSRRIKRR